MTTTLILCLVWYAIGLAGAVKWARTYRKVMDYKDWKSAVWLAPFIAITGPVTFLLSTPG